MTDADPPRIRRDGHALVLGDGSPPSRVGLEVAWPGWDDAVSLVIAADGGARLADPLGVRLDRWVGDADSYPPEAVDRLQASGVATRVVASTKDESDLELAIVEAAASGAGRITVLGGLGGSRLDHALANISLLAHPALAGLDVELLDDRTRVRLVSATRAGSSGGPMTMSLSGRTGDLVSLLPISGVVNGVTTRGLRYPLTDEPLVVGPARGLSNVRAAPEASVSVRDGRLLVVETVPDGLSGAPARFPG